MKFVALLSGGKDSCYAAMLAVDAGHELTCLANLYPGRGDNGDEINSFMYQSAAHVGIPYLAECFGKPLFRRQIKGKSLDQSLSYSNNNSNSNNSNHNHATTIAVAPSNSNPNPDGLQDYDEVEDLYLLLLDVKVSSCCHIMSSVPANRRWVECTVRWLDTILLLSTHTILYCNSLSASSVLCWGYSNFTLTYSLTFVLLYA